MLEKQVIPAVEVSTSSDGEPTLILVETGQNSPYIAFSHVWSDGLGNPLVNSLPQCQLERLSQWHPVLDTETQPFWVDTLCCPVNPPEATELAIKLMRKTYENASRVIVIDSWLQNQKVSDLSIAEIIMRIALSGWTRRLWTYQEGTINKKLSVWFADKTVDIDTAIQNLVLHEDLDWLAMKRCFTGVYGQLRGLVRRR